MKDFDLNKLPDDEVSFKSTPEPFIGQIFSSDEEAFQFYKRFAEQQGFSVRKDRSVKKDGIFVRRDFYCLRAGKPELKILDPTKEPRKRESSKCECNAHLRITFRKCFDIFLEEWHVTKYVTTHNHDLLSHSEMRFFPAKRLITPEDESRILLLKEASLSVRQIIRVIELEKDVEHGTLPYLDRDIRNLFVKVKKKLAANDVKDLLDYMKSHKEANSKFQYAVTVDDERRIENVFWSHAQCFDWYESYGDVVLFDTTYKVNAYDMPCGIFVGVNNHGKTILFGCALLRNETNSTFKWLMETFVSKMGRSPKTIITDQDPWLTKAISTEMPLSKHIFCIWHITSKFSSWFCTILRNEYHNWCSDFFMLYKLNSPEKFEREWSLVMDKYNLTNNKHIRGLYDIRNYWAPPYLRDYFFGGMTTTGRSESINAFIKKFVSSHTCLKDFANQVQVALQEVVHSNSHDKMLTNHKIRNLVSKSPLEEQASRVLTPFALKKFQEELGQASLYSIMYEKEDEYILSYYTGGTRK